MELVSNTDKVNEVPLLEAAAHERPAGNGVDTAISVGGREAVKEEGPVVVSLVGNHSSNESLHDDDCRKRPLSGAYQSAPPLPPIKKPPDILITNLIISKSKLHTIIEGDESNGKETNETEEEGAWYRNGWLQVMVMCIIAIAIVGTGMVMGVASGETTPHVTPANEPEAPKATTMQVAVGGVEGRAVRSTPLSIGIGRLKLGEYVGLKAATSEWTWDEELHGQRSELAQVRLPVIEGKTEPRRRWTFHDAYCGIGGLESGLSLAGGVCTAAFDLDAGARGIYAKRVGKAPHGKWGSFDPRSWPPARVLVSAPPCEDRPELIGQNHHRQMWKHLELVKVHEYEMIVMELLLHFKRMQNGMVFRDLIAHVTQLGYDVRCRMLFAPKFGAVAARKRLYLFCTKQEGQGSARLQYPVGGKQRHPVYSILEPEFFRRGVRLRASDCRWLDAPKQRTTDSLVMIGEMTGSGRGRGVYSTSGLASTQLASGKGIGWTTGIYKISGVPSRLTTREAARTLQISDHVEFGDNNATAARYLGNTTPVGTARALGVCIERYLSSESPDTAVVGGMDVDGSNSRHWRLAPSGQK